MSIITILLSVFLWVNPVFYIRNINKLQRESLLQYEQRNYAEVARLHQVLLQEYNFQNEMLYLNVAHNYFRLNKPTQAVEYYQKALQSNEVALQSIALNQLAIIAEADQNTEDALELLKKAIILYPANNIARYNYELLKKKTQEIQKQQNKIQNLPNSNSENEQSGKATQIYRTGTKKIKSSSQLKSISMLKENKIGRQRLDKKTNKDDKDKDKESEDRAKNLKIKKLAQINLDAEKAHQILEAMKNQETQYLQQRKIKSQPPKNNTPPW